MELFTIIAQLVNFVILIFILNKFLYKPVLLTLEKRRNDIKKKIEETERKLSESEQLKEEYLNKLNNLMQENEDLKHKALQDIKKFKELEIQKAKDDVAARKNKFTEYLDFEEKSLIENFNEKFGKLFVSYSNMLLKNIANSDLEKEVLNKFIEKIKLLNLQKIDEINSLRSDTVLILSNNKLTSEQQEIIKETLQHKKIKFSNINFEVDANLILGIQMKVKSYVLSWDVRELSSDFLNSIGKE
ncbi:MAG TPA: hypothetical protein VLL98_00920 [Rickettsiales bacterium]|nr:hypothetical protein [Rickettsiales bacterium]